MQICTKIRWFFLLMAGLVILLFPVAVFAQEGRSGLDMIVISGHYDDIKAGEDSIFFLEVRNSGDTEIHNIRFTATTPEGWTVLFEPPEIAYLGLDSVYAVNVNVRPADRTEQGDYRVTLIAKANETRVMTTLWITVEGPSYWLWVGIILAVVIIAGFVFIYMSLGRRG